MSTMMMSPPTFSFVHVRHFVAALVTAGAVSGFTLSSPPPLIASSLFSSTPSYQRIATESTATPRFNTAIHVGASPSFNTNDHDDIISNNGYNYNYQQLLLDHASACALSDNCSIECAELYLREIFRAQVECAILDVELPVAANVATADTGKTDSVGRMSVDECNVENLHVIGEIVAKLKNKIRHHYESGRQSVNGKYDAVTTFWNQRQVELETLANAADAASTSFAAPLKPAYLAIAALYSMAIMHAFQYSNPPLVLDSASIVPFTFEEVWYAIRDGYIGTLVGHWFRNGGLLVGGSVNGVIDGTAINLLSSSLPSTTTASAPSFFLSPREVFWSIRDGYVDDTLFSSSVTSSVPSLLSKMDSSIGDAVVPFSPQEVWWAVQGGYVADLVRHWFHNGGL